MSKELTMVEISYDFEALQMDMENGSLKFNLTINQMVKDGLLALKYKEVNHKDQAYMKKDILR
jgi:hypothetical protein